MTYSYGKKSVGQRLKSAFIKVAGVGLIAGVPLWYQYGTTEEKEVTIKSIRKIDDNGKVVDEKKQAASADDADKKYTYQIVTTGGEFKNETSWLHLKFSKDNIQDGLEKGAVYKFKSYGKEVSFLGMHLRPNILKADVVTQDEIEDRKAAAVKPAAQPVQNAASVNNIIQELSGRMAIRDIHVQGYTIQITMPEEAVGKVTVNAITPVKKPDAPKL